MDNNYQTLFGTDPEMIYLNHAAVGSLPLKTMHAMNSIIETRCKIGEPPLDQIFAKLDQFREILAQMLQCSRDELSFIHNTTEGLSIALYSIPWETGDNIIVQADAFPSSLYVLEHEFKHVKKNYVALNDDNCFYKRLQEKIDTNTRAIIVDHVHFLSGYRLDIAQLGKIAARHNLYLIVDGIQAAGAIRINLQDSAVHFYCAGGMKWLLGPMGTGFLYVNSDIMNELTINHVGWLSAEHDDLSNLYPVKPVKKSAKRFERANFNVVGLYGLCESLNILKDVGCSEIEDSILAKTGHFIDDLEQSGFDLLTPKEPFDRAGIVSFRSSAISSEELHAGLTSEKIICSLREGWIRIACHFLNTVEQLSKVTTFLNQFE